MIGGDIQLLGPVQSVWFPTGVLRMVANIYAVVFLHENAPSKSVILIMQFYIYLSRD